MDARSPSRGRLILSSGALFLAIVPHIYVNIRNAWEMMGTSGFIFFIEAAAQ